MDFGNIVGMEFGLSRFFAGIPTALQYLTLSVTKQLGSKYLQQRKDAVVGPFQPICFSFTARVHFARSASSRGNSSKLYPSPLTELQPAAAQHLGMIKLSCEVSTSC